MCGTRSSLARSHKGRFGGENLKGCEAAESNQKSERVNRIPWLEATTASSSLAPLAGRGRGEGASQRSWTRGESPSPGAAR